MKFSTRALLFALGMAGAAIAAAQVPADAPAGTTGLCKDGSYSSDAVKKGSCRGHKGVKTWYAAAAAPAPAAAPAAVPASAVAPAPTVAAAPAAKPAPAAKTAAAAAPAAGDVWVNTSTKAYHCAGSRWYGKTKQGSYMSEAAAKAAGYHADHGKACS